MLRGKPMTVWHKTVDGSDGMGEPTVKWVPETVDNVLWGPTKSDRLKNISGQLGSGARPEGTEDTITAHFPSVYTKSLAGCQLEAYGRRWNVLGDPPSHLSNLVPGKWNRTVVARVVDG